MIAVRGIAHLIFRADHCPDGLSDHMPAHFFRHRFVIILLADLIKEGVSIQTDSDEFIQMRIISHLGTGRDSIVFLAEALDYGIMQAVLKVGLVVYSISYHLLQQLTRFLSED